MLDWERYIIVMILGFSFLILGAINGGIECIPFNMNMMPEILATSTAIVGGITVIFFILLMMVLELLNSKKPYEYGEMRKEESLKTYDKEEFKENQKKWREHYSKLKAKRGL